MARKTADVADILHRANVALAVPSSTYSLDDYTPEQAFRLGVVAVLEQVLHSTGNYRGFNYLASEFATGGQPTAGDTPLREDYDGTRRYYYGEPA